MLALLRTFSWQDLRHHPWRSLCAVGAVMLGVALALAVDGTHPVSYTHLTLPTN